MFNNENTTAEQQQDDTNYLNTLRVFATFSVMMIHIFAPIDLYFSNLLTECESYICAILYNLWQWSVPLFVMITGVLFLNPNKNITLEKILKKYVLRIVLAILLFGLPYCFMELFFNDGFSFNINQIGSSVLNTIQGKSWDHMWYLYMLAGLYLFTPFIKIFVNTASKNIMQYVLVILFIFTSIIPSLESILPYKFGIYIPINSVYVFYLLLGYYIHYNKITIRINILFLLFMLYVAFVIVMHLSLKPDGLIKLTEYHSPIVVMATFSFFGIIKSKNQK